MAPDGVPTSGVRARVAKRAGRGRARSSIVCERRGRAPPTVTGKQTHTEPRSCAHRRAPGMRSDGIVGQRGESFPEVPGAAIAGIPGALGRRRPAATPACLQPHHGRRGGGRVPRPVPPASLQIVKYRCQTTMYNNRQRLH